jgi:hypothetical protein
MVWSHEHSPRFSYVRDFRPRGVFSYAPAMWGHPRARDAHAKEEGIKEGEQTAQKQMMMVGGAILGVVAVGALVYMAAKK